VSEIADTDQHAAFVRTTRRVGPYLTLARGIALEQENIAWRDTASRVVTARAAGFPAHKRTPSA
jgi:Virulence activator alpha C-term